QDVVHARRFEKIERHLPDGKAQGLRARKKMSLFDAEPSQKFGAAALEKAQIARVIDNARKVGVLVINTDWKTMAAVSQLSAEARTRRPHSWAPSSNKPNCAGGRGGSASPRWRNACGVKSRPRGVRWRKPC